MRGPTQKLFFYTNPDGHAKKQIHLGPWICTHNVYKDVIFSHVLHSLQAVSANPGGGVDWDCGIKFRGPKCLEITSLSQRPLKHTESYSLHLHPHLQTNFSHSWYSKQTSFWMETYASLITHVQALCAHMTTLPPTIIPLCLQFVFSGRSRSRLHRHNASKPSTSADTSLVFPCLVLTSQNTGR